MPNGEKRVFIRPLAYEDCDAFLAAVRRSRSLHRNWINPKAATRAAFTAYLKRFADDAHHGFVVVARESGELVGAINLNDVIRGSFQSASVGYYAFTPHAGRGFMREGLLLVLSRAFQHLKLHRVEANIQPENEASIALVKRCGFIREGYSRRLLKVCGRWKDHERWAILAEDFTSRR
jgi:[ribosomal protein S5]-alanine N-acetyltransferase